MKMYFWVRSLRYKIQLQCVNILVEADRLWIYFTFRGVEVSKSIQRIVHPGRQLFARNTRTSDCHRVVVRRILQYEYDDLIILEST